MSDTKNAITNSLEASKLVGAKFDFSISVLKIMRKSKFYLLMT